MRIALLAPLPPEQTGIADYAAHLRSALREQGLEVLTPLEGCLDLAQQLQRLQAFDWRGVDLVHAELGGGRFAEFQALDYLRRTQPQLPLTATVHDPERLIWRRAKLFFPLTLLERLPHPLPQAAALLADPLTLYEERRLAKSMRRLITLTRLGGDCLRQRMGMVDRQAAAGDREHCVHDIVRDAWFRGGGFVLARHPSLHSRVSPPATPPAAPRGRTTSRPGPARRRRCAGAGGTAQDR